MVPGCFRFLGLAALAFASAAEPASPRIELYTMGRGEDLFTMFGHAALCAVEKDLPGGGLCYNYGTSDFSRPVGLAWDVVRGRAEFWVSVSDLPSMLYHFSSDLRTIYRQEVPLPEERALALARRLAVDASPENRSYVYHHFLDNCSTRPRDHIDQATDGALRRLDFADGGSYRGYAAEGLGAFHWLLVPAGDLVMGRWVDQEISTYEAMFIPEVLRRGVEIALGSEPEIVYRRPLPEPGADVSAARRATGIGGIVLVAVLAVAIATGRRRLFVLGPLLLTALGALLLFAALVSRLPELRGNELLAVFLPLDFLLLSASRRMVAAYGGVRLGGLALVGLLAAAGVLVQPIWPFWALATGIVGLRVVDSRRG